MPKKKTVLSFLLIVAMVFAIALTALADGQISTEDITITTETNPYKYGTAPDGLFVFLYHGYNPYFTEELDTSNCQLQYLYVHNQVTNEIVEISTENVTHYTETQDALFYVTSSNTIYKTDYTGSTHTIMSQFPNDAIRGLTSYLDTLAFIKNNRKIVFLDTVTGESITVLQHDGIDWFFVLSNVEIVVADLSNEFYIYDLEKRTVKRLDNEAIASNLINQAVLSELETSQNEGATASVSAQTITTKIQENDISFPLSNYPATLGATPNFTHQRPSSWFHINGQEGCNNEINCDGYSGTTECEGFARYAHDAYLHIVDSSYLHVKENATMFYEWKSTRHSAETDYQFDGSVETLKMFFNNMRPGAYVRYGRTTDPTPGNGVHSIVFVNIDQNGIWVYECNQDYDDNPDHGCGVHYQYYTFDLLVTKYHFADHHVNHSFSGGNTCSTLTKHKVECASCYGYLMQSHTGSKSYAYLNPSKHKVFYSCCSGYVTEPHNMVLKMCLDCDYAT